MRDAGRGKGQLPIPHPRKIDRYGLCAQECECARCNLGFRPSIAERDAARRAWERFEQKRKADAAGTTTKAGEKTERRRAAFRGEEQFTDHLISKLTAPVERPATPEELEALKQQYPNLRRRKP